MKLVVKKDFPEIAKQRDLIILEHQKYVEEGFGEKVIGKTTEFQSIVFCSDILIGKEIHIGKCTITPFGGIDNGNYFDYVNEYLKSKGLTKLSRVETSPSEYSHDKKPGVVILIPTIHSQTKEQAGNQAYDIAKNIINAISLSNNSYGNIIGDVLINKDTPLIYHRFQRELYQGNLLVGAESAMRIYEISEKIKDDPLKKFYLDLYLECCKERKKTAIKIFKMWNLLETIARNKKLYWKTEIQFIE